MPRRLGASEWESLIAEYRQSGLSQKEFVAKHDVSLSTLQFWLYKQSKRKSVSDSNSSPAFVPIEVVASAAPKARAGGAVEIAVDGLTLRVAVGTDPKWLAQLLRALQ